MPSATKAKVVRRRAKIRRRIRVFLLRITSRLSGGLD
jgi:hypothetical protein